MSISSSSPPSSPPPSHSVFFLPWRYSTCHRLFCFSLHNVFPVPRKFSLALPQPPRSHSLRIHSLHRTQCHLRTLLFPALRNPRPLVCRPLRFLVDDACPP